MSALKHDLFNIFKTLSTAPNIDFDAEDSNGQTVEDLARWGLNIGAIEL